MSQKNAPYEPDDYDNQDCDAHCDTHPDPSFFNLDLSPWKPRNTLVRVFKRHRCIHYIYGEDCTLILVRPERYTGTPGGASHLNSVTTARLHATPSTRHIKRMEMQRDRKGWGTLSCARARVFWPAFAAGGALPLNCSRFQKQLNAEWRNVRSLSFSPP